MKKNKFILTVLVFALALCMLVACGEKPQAPNGNQQGGGNGGGGESPKLTTYTAIFTDENLSNTSGIVFNSSRDADNFELVAPSRGVQFYKKGGAVTIVANNLTNVTKVTLLVSSNKADTAINVKVGDVDFVCDGKKSVSFQKMMSLLRSQPIRVWMGH